MNQNRINTVYRDPKTGRRITDIDAHKEQLALASKLDGLEEIQRRSNMGIAAWGKQGGVRQSADEAGRLSHLSNMKNLSFNTSKDDKEYNKKLRSVQRWDDPMRSFSNESPCDEFRMPELKNTSDFTIKANSLFCSDEEEQEEAVKSDFGPLNPSSIGASISKGSSVYTGHGPPNRFNIAPGPLWDSVGNIAFYLSLDRSNGFEVRYLSAISNKVAFKEKAYKFLTEDM